MHGWPDRAWGKFDAGDEANPQWHPLVDHCADVAACCEALLRQPMINRRMAVLAGLDSLDEILIARLSVLAFLHDIGKANRGFQRKILRRSPSPYAGHVKELHWLFRADDELALQASDALRLERISCWFTDTTAALLVASISHHGKPWNPDNDQAGRRDWWLPDDTHDPMATLREMGARLENWFPEAFKLSGPFDAPPEFQHAFAGLVSLADWLGSDRRIFPYAEKGEGNRIGFAREAARTALRDIGLDVTRRRNIVAVAHRRLDDFFEFTPNALQRAVDEIDISPLVVMESETGSGKTEAAFWYFKQLFEAGAVDGLYFALPTRVAATQLHARLTKMIKRLFEEEERPGVVLAVPGYFRVDDVEGERALEKFEVLWADDDPDRSRHRYWAAENPKRYLAAQIAVGTIDQVLLSALTLKHADLRATALMRHLLVVDEVHASDAYMNRLLEAVLDTHLAAGGHALLMSATLGSDARARFLGGAPADKPAPEAAIAFPYPLLTWKGPDGAGALPVESDHPAKSVAVEIAPRMEDPEATASLAAAAARDGAKVLVVRNTVDLAIATQQALEALTADMPDAPLFCCNGVVTLHHGRFARDDRRLLDAAVETQVGKDRPAGGLVVIGTQTLEQSLDIDADLLIADLCPMDVLLQRLGRLHRHARDERPPGLETPHAIVLRPTERDLSPERHGLRRLGLGGHVYSDLRVLEATLQLLETHDVLEIPAMNRALVERATHPDLLDALAAEMGPAWETHGQTIAGVAFAEKNTAVANTIRRDRAFGDEMFPDDMSGIATRLGADDRLVVWKEDVDPPTGPFGEPVGHLVIPSWRCGGIPADATATPEAMEEPGFRFRLGPALFTYDRLGLRKET